VDLRAKALTIEQARALLEVARTKPFGSLVRFLLDAGCRSGEAFALSWDDVNLKEAWANIRFSMSSDDGRAIRKAVKNEFERRVYLEPGTLAALAAHAKNPHARWNLVWTNSEGEPLDRNNFRKRVAKPMFAEAGLAGFVPHTLRHTVASLQLAQGSDIPTVQKRGGWADTRTLLNIYAHVFDGTQKELVAKMHSAKRQPLDTETFVGITGTKFIRPKHRAANKPRD